MNRVDSPSAVEESSTTRARQTSQFPFYLPERLIKEAPFVLVEGTTQISDELQKFKRSPSAYRQLVRRRLV